MRSRRESWHPTTQHTVVWALVFNVSDHPRVWCHQGLRMVEGTNPDRYVLVSKLQATAG